MKEKIWRMGVLEITVRVIRDVSKARAKDHKELERSRWMLIYTYYTASGNFAIYSRRMNGK